MNDITLRDGRIRENARRAAAMSGQRGSNGVVSGDTDLGDLRGLPQGRVPDPGAAIGLQHPAR
jgi:hypothetical protein